MRNQLPPHETFGSSDRKARRTLRLGAGILLAWVGTASWVQGDVTLTNLVWFNVTNGANPAGALVLTSNGDLYGTTAGGGAYDPNGTAFRTTAQGLLSTVVSFDFSSGSTPNGLMQGSDGNFYGTTYLGGSYTNDPFIYGRGTVFKMSPDGTLTTLISFNETNGAQPLGPLVQSSDGTFYGTTAFGGEYGLGTLFRLSVPDATGPKIQTVTQSGDRIMLGWGALPGRTYQAQYMTNLSQMQWIDFGGVITGTNGMASVSDLIGPDPQRFYRVALLP